MNSKELFQKTLSHQKPDRIPIDFGATSVTGIHCKVVKELRDYYGFPANPVKVIEPYQMLGEIDDELLDAMGIDAIPVFGRKDLFGIEQENFKEQTTPWGQSILIADKYDFKPDTQGNIYAYPEGDLNIAPSGIMPASCYFFNAIERQKEIDESAFSARDNIEEFGCISEIDLNYFEMVVNKAATKNKCVVASFGGTALGDVALIPGIGLREPKGIRGVEDWYISTVLRQDFIHEMFESQINIAIENYKKLWARVGSKVDVVYLCGADFGTQSSQFCSTETFNNLWLPHYRRMTDWIHQNTTWKVFKHSCGAILPLLPSMIEAGFDIINPVQINAKDMDSKLLKSEFGNKLTFWGGGVDTQITLPSAKPSDVRSQVLRQCEILGNNGGFVFSSVHNIQANVPVENVISMINAVHEFNKNS